MRGCVSFFIETFFNNHIIAMIKKAYALCALFGACATFGAGFQVGFGTRRIKSRLGTRRFNRKRECGRVVRVLESVRLVRHGPEAGRHCDGQRNEFCSSVIFF